ncbi:MAG: hypothetical protein F6K47_33105 [Symploca sp. SIO2E6]|nr:hypothetical protein [Symploca sp. SIO2E6]
MTKELANEVLELLPMQDKKEEKIPHEERILNYTLEMLKGVGRYSEKGLNPVQIDMYFSVDKTQAEVGKKLKGVALRGYLHNETAFSRAVDKIRSRVPSEVGEVELYKTERGLSGRLETNQFSGGDDDYEDLSLGAWLIILGILGSIVIIACIAFGITPTILRNRLRQLLREGIHPFRRVAPVAATAIQGNEVQNAVGDLNVGVRQRNAHKTIKGFVGLIVALRHLLVWTFHELVSHLHWWQIVELLGSWLLNVAAMVLSDGASYLEEVVELYEELESLLELFQRLERELLTLEVREQVE